MTDWTRLGQPDFDRTVEALILRKIEREEPGLLATSLDGRGGDGGVDIDVTVKSTGKLVRIYQLKFFPEGFSGLWRGRQTQIKRSFKSAAKLKPETWIFVAPRNFTTGERKFLRELTKGTGIRLGRIGRVELDSMRADDPSLISSLERRADREALKLVGRESAALETSDDLISEVRKLQNRSDTISAYWGLEFSNIGGTNVHTVRAKRPDAAEREPLSVQFEANFENEPELRRAFTDSMKFGVFETVTLPPSVLREVEFTGPSWFARKLDAPTLVLTPAENAGLSFPVTLQISPPEQAPYKLRGTATKVASGEGGVRILTEFPGGLACDWRIPSVTDPELTTPFTLDFEPTGHSAVEVERCIKARRLMAAGTEVTVEKAEGVLARAVINDGPPLELPAEFEELVSDLAYVERNTDAKFSFPETLGTILERKWLRVVRNILDGKVQLVPGIDGINLTLSGEIDEGVEKLLTEPQALAHQVPEDTFEIYGETVVLPNVMHFHPSIFVRDGATHLDLLRQGKGAGLKIHVEPTDRAIGFRIYLARGAASAGDTQVERWGITGIPEHRELGGGE